MQVLDLLNMQTAQLKERNNNMGAQIGNKTEFAGLLEMLTQQMVCSTSSEQANTSKAVIAEKDLQDNQDWELNNFLNSLGLLDINSNLASQMLELNSGEESNTAFQSQVAETFTTEHNLQSSLLFRDMKNLINSLPHTAVNIDAGTAARSSGADNLVSFMQALNQFAGKENLQQTSDSPLANVTEYNLKNENTADKILGKIITELVGEQNVQQEAEQGKKNGQNISEKAAEVLKLGNEQTLKQSASGKENTKITNEQTLNQLVEDEGKQDLSSLIKENNADNTGGNEKQKTSSNLPNNNTLGNNNFRQTLELTATEFMQTNEQEVSVKEIPEFLLKQISGKIIANKADGTQELNIRLKPAELGRMSIQLSAHDGQVAVKIITDNTNARELVEQNIVHLKQSLADQGIKCNSIDVQVSTDSSFNQFMGHQSNLFNQSRQSGKNKFAFPGGKKEEKDALAGMEKISPGSNSGLTGLSSLEILA